MCIIGDNYAQLLHKQMCNMQSVLCARVKIFLKKHFFSVQYT